MDPYLVSSALLETICGAGFKAPPVFDRHADRYLEAGFEEIWPESGPAAPDKTTHEPVNGA